MSKNIAVIICAAGASKRFGGKRKKPFVDVAGKAALLHSVELFEDMENVKQILLAISPKDEELVSVKWGPNLKFFGVKTYFGGAERFETVQNGLELIKDDIDLVAVHDAARCCITKNWVNAVFAEAEKTGAAILASPIVATVKKCDDGVITKSIDRTGLFEAQTPQVFNKDLLIKAYDNLKNLDAATISDDSQLVEALGEKVSIVEADASNIKITHKNDIAIAEAIIKNRPKTGPKGPLGAFEEAQW
jgi:2-C-methyl-D-erythritol 4-phosphate cytidylyltransferase